MFTALVLVAVMAVLYGLAWHNESANHGENKSRPNRNK